MDSETTDLTLRDYLRILFRQKAVVLTAILTVTVTVFVGLKFKTNVYEAQVKVLVSAEKMVDSPYYRDLLSSQRTEVTITQGEIVKSAPVIEQTVKALMLYKRPFDYEAKYCSPWKRPLVEFFSGLQEERLKAFSEDMKNSYRFRMAVENLKTKIKVEPIRDTNTFTISVKDYDPIGAAMIANTLSRAYLIYDLQQQLAEVQLKYGDKHPTVMQLMNNISDLAKTLHGQPVSTRDALGTASSKVVEQANVPIEPTGIGKVPLFILGFFMSLFLGVMLAFVFEYMDHTFKMPQEIETVLGLPFLGAVPRKKRLRSHAVQTLADQMYLIMKDKGLKSVMIAGADSSAPSAALAASLARELAAKSSKRVLLIDADLRAKKQQSIKYQVSSHDTGHLTHDTSEGAGHLTLNTSESPGLSEILEGKTSFDACVKMKGQDCAILPAGKTALNPVTLIDSGAMHSLLKSVKEKFDMIFINVPPLIPHKDTETLSAYVDGAVVVVTEGRTRRHTAQAAVQPLRDKKANLLGAVLNGRTFPIPKFLYERV